MSREGEELISDFLMGELPHDERELMLERMREDPALRERVTSLEAVAAKLESLPHEAWQTLGEQPTMRSARMGRAAPRVRMALVAAACALLLGAGIGIGVLIERPGTTAGATAVLRPLAGPSSEQATARMTPGGRMILSVAHLRPTAPGRFYELWLMNSTTDLVSVASFRVGSDGRAELNVPLPVSAAHYRFLDISLQQASAGPAHSGNSVLRAAIPS